MRIEDKATLNRQAIQRLTAIPRDCLANHDTLQFIEMSINYEGMSPEDIENSIYLLEEMRSYFLQIYLDSISGRSIEMDFPPQSGT